MNGKVAGLQTLRFRFNSGLGLQLVDTIRINPMTKNQHTKENYEIAAKSVENISDMCRFLGIMPVGGNYKTVRKYIELYEIDTTHFKNRVSSESTRYKDSPTTTTHIKKKMIRDRGHQCEQCKNDKWLGEPITLELEHIDGNHTNNLDTNLSLLCPNCHSYTKTWRRKKSSFEYKKPARKSRAGKGYKDLCGCGSTKLAESKQCSACYNQSRQEKILWPTHSVLLGMIESIGYTSVSQLLGVSEAAVRNRANGKG